LVPKERKRVRVLDTKKENTLVYHIVDRLPEQIDDARFECEVDEPKRRLTEATTRPRTCCTPHCAVLGTHVQQKGSYLDHEDTCVSTSSISKN
jgi:alanyl-tRNA synthetase